MNTKTNHCRSTFDAELTGREATRIGMRYGVTFTGCKRVYMLFAQDGTPIVDTHRQPITGTTRHTFERALEREADQVGEVVRLRSHQYTVTTTGIEIDTVALHNDAQADDVERLGY